MTMNRSLAALLGGLCLTALLCTGCSAAEGLQVPAKTGENSVLLTEEATGWQHTDSGIFYMRDGEKVTGWLELEGNHYYFRGNGSLVTGWLSLDGNRYYLGPDGAAYQGVREVDGKLYLFSQQGLLTTGWTSVDGATYYGDENGHPLSGWQEIGGIRYYLGEDFAVHTGWLELNGFTYYLKEDGSVAQGKLEIDGRTHYFAFNGQEIVLVNPWHEIPEDYTVTLTDIGSGHQVADIALEDLQAMLSAGRAAGVAPAVCSSYRTIEYQTKLFNKKVKYYLEKGYDEAEAYATAGTIVAVPGTSEHHLGLALDIVDNHNWTLDESQAKTAAQKWLMANSWRYGWILRYPDGSSESTGIIYEPWHYRYVGREVAEDIFNSGLCLEDYLEMLTK